MLRFEVFEASPPELTEHENAPELVNNVCALCARFWLMCMHVVRTTNIKSPATRIAYDWELVGLGVKN